MWVKLRMDMEKYVGHEKMWSMMDTEKDESDCKQMFKNK
jgi:hypothetical protein